MASIYRGSTRVLFILVLIVGAGCQAVAPTEFSSDIDDLLSRGEAYSRSLSVRSGDAPSDAAVIARGYLERGRVGLGSPFRLLSYVKRDPRLTPETRELLAYALLSQALEGRGFQVDPAVLDVLRLIGVAPSYHPGEAHLRLIEQTVAQAPSAQVGERAVRLGYMLAGVERTVEGGPESVVAYVTALVADRRRAREDAVDLLRTAAARRVDPLDLLEQWRRELQFRVERPSLTHVSASAEVAEARLGAQTATSLRVLAQRMGVPRSWVHGVRSQDFWGDSWLDEPAAARLRELAGAQDYPAQAPIAVAVTINRDALVSRPGLTAAQKEDRIRFADAAINEETLVAASAQLRMSGSGAGTRLPLTLLQAAVFLRGWNQEEPWFPGDPAPSSRDLENRFGLARIEFDRAVPESWRPYYRRMLGRALGDLQRVLPTASLRGLNIHFGEVPTGVSALALHDPRGRVLTLPPHSGAGTIAHEIAHDLDWQLARRRYDRRGSYATDLAVQRQKGDRIAASLAGLAAAFEREGSEGSATAHDRRPAEIFARSLDWLVAAQLAAEGRSGGYLSSFQDAALPGYGSTRGPHLDGNAVPALLAILEQIAPASPELRQWANDTYGPARTLTAKELVRALTSAARDGDAFARFLALEGARDRALTGLSAVSCRMSPSQDARRLVAARQSAIHGALDAVARGIVIDGVRSVASTLPEPPARSAVDDFLIWRLDGGPEPADSSVHALQPAADELLFRLASLREEPAAAGGGFLLNPERSLCGGNPFASGPGERWRSDIPLARRAAVQG